MEIEDYFNTTKVIPILTLISGLKIFQAFQSMSRLTYTVSIYLGLSLKVNVAFGGFH